MVSYAFLAFFIIGLLLGVRIMLHGVERPARASRPASAAGEASAKPTPVGPRFALDLPTAAGFAAAFGATGYLLVRYTLLGPAVDAVIAAILGAAGAIGAVALVAAWAIPAAKAEVVDERYLFQGAFARVTGVSDRGATGTIVYHAAVEGAGSGKPGRQGEALTLPATGLDGARLEVGAEVVIERIENGMAYVEPWARVEARL